MMTKKSDLAHVLVPSNLIATMTGCRQISKHRDKIILHYTDGTEESVIWPGYDIFAKKDNFFSIVSDIQQKSRQASTTCAKRIP